jgi:bifunctional non-homologous end joining protein LigD
VAAPTEPLPTALSPMLATAGQLPIGPEWTYEMKWDGVRGLITISPDGTVSIRTRAGNDVTDQFPELAMLAGPADGHQLVLDGEVVAFDEAGRPSFNRLQGRLGVRGHGAQARSRENPVLFAVFDLLHLDGLSTRSLSLEQRRHFLEQLNFERGPQWVLSALYDDGELLQGVTRQNSIEGVVAKRLDSPYLPGIRSRSWIKVRNVNQDTFVIGGWIPGEGRREHTIGSLLIGTPADDTGNVLQSVGRVGTGFTDAELARLTSLLGPLRRPTSAFDTELGERSAVFVEPVLEIAVEYLEFTPEGNLRAPSYKGIVGTRPGG